MDFNDFEGGYRGSFSSGGSYSFSHGWDDFTLDDEVRAKKRFSRVFLAISLYLIISIVLIYAAQIACIFIMGNDKAAEFFDYTMLIIANGVAMYVIALPILFLMLRKMRSTARMKSNIGIGEFLKIFLIAEACMYIGSVIGNSVNSFISTITGVPIEDRTAEMIENTPIWLIILMVVIIGPIVEEFIFRKLFMDKLGMYGDRLAIVVSAIAFGLFHGNLYQFFYAALLGIVLGYLYSRTSNILYPIALHMIMNFLGSVIPMLLMDKIIRYEELANEILQGAEIDIAEYYQLTLIVGGYSMVQLALVISGVIVFFKYRKSFYVSDRCEVLIPKNRRAHVILLNVGAILFLVVCAISIASEIVMPIIENLGQAAEQLPTDNLPTDQIPSGGGSNI